MAVTKVEISKKLKPHGWQVLPKLRFLIFILYSSVYEHMFLMEILANYTTPEEMLSVDSQTLADFLNKVSHGRFGLDKAKQIQQTAKNSFGIVLASSSFFLIIRQYLE